MIPHGRNPRKSWHLRFFPRATSRVQPKYNQILLSDTLVASWWNVLLVILKSWGTWMRQKAALNETKDSCGPREHCWLPGSGRVLHSSLTFHWLSGYNKYTPMKTETKGSTSWSVRSALAYIPCGLWIFNYMQIYLFKLPPGLPITHIHRNNLCVKATYI